MNQKPCLLTRRKFGMAPVHRDPPDEEGSTLKGWGEAIIFWVNFGLTDSADDVNPFVGLSYRF